MPNSLITATQSKERLILVLQDEANITLSASAICRKAGISRTSYYRFFQDSGFLHALKEVGIQTIHGSLLQIINSAIRLAKKGSFPHQKLLIELALQVEIKENLQYRGDPVVHEYVEKANQLPEHERKKLIKWIERYDDY